LFSFSDVSKATNCTFQEGVCIGCFCTSYIVSNHIVDTDHCRQIEGRCQLSPRYLSNFWAS
jgi:hypothetical protein